MHAARLETRSKLGPTVGPEEQPHELGRHRGRECVAVTADRQRQVIDDDADVVRGVLPALRAVAPETGCVIQPFTSVAPKLRSNFAYSDCAAPRRWSIVIAVPASAANTAAPSAMLAMLPPLTESRASTSMARFTVGAGGGNACDHICARA